MLPGPGGPERSSRSSCGLSPGTQMRSCWPPVGQVGGDAGPVQQSRLSRCGAARGLQGAPARGGQRGQGPGSGRLSHLPHLTKTPRPGNVSNCPTALGSPGVLLVPQHRGARSLMDWPCGGQGRGSHEMQLPNDETPPPAPPQGSHQDASPCKRLPRRSPGRRGARPSRSAGAVFPEAPAPRSRPSQALPGPRPGSLSRRRAARSQQEPWAQTPASPPDLGANKASRDSALRDDKDGGDGVDGAGTGASPLS